MTDKTQDMKSKDKCKLLLHSLELYGLNSRKLKFLSSAKGELQSLFVD